MLPGQCLPEERPGTRSFCFKDTKECFNLYENDIIEGQYEEP